MPKDKTQFSTGATRDTMDGKPRTDLLPFDLLLRVADWYGLGATKYGDNNWRKGQKVSHCVGSIMRHLSKWVMGNREEDHLSAIVFNALSIMNVEMYHIANKDINDMNYSTQEWFYSNGFPMMTREDFQRLFWESNQQGGSDDLRSKD